MKTRKYRIYPNKIQQQMLAQYFGNARFVYNRWLIKREELYERWEKPNYYRIVKYLPQLKEENLFLKDSYAQTLQCSLLNLSQWYIRFFKKISRHPKLKKKRWVQSIMYPQKCKLLESWNIFIPKLGEIKTKLSRECIWKIKSVTVTMTCTWKYFVSILTDYEPRKPIVSGTVGIDIWVKHFAVLSDWTFIDKPYFFWECDRRLSKANKKLSKKVYGSKNRLKQKKKVSLIYEKITNKRVDFINKVVYNIVNKYHTIVVEWFNITELLEKNVMSNKIQDANRWRFRVLLDYKANEVIQIDKYFPSTKLCSYCWWIQEMNLSDRIYHCKKCWHKIDRDLNAAINILMMGTKS